MIRDAHLEDVPAMHALRMRVKENVLRDPRLVTLDDYRSRLQGGAGAWVFELNGIVVGFAIIEPAVQNVWALFVDPDHERKGIGRALHDAMLNWVFDRAVSRVALTTQSVSRAADFYVRAGWTEIPCGDPAQSGFEMTRERWLIGKRET